MIKNSMVGWYSTITQAMAFCILKKKKKKFFFLPLSLCRYRVQGCSRHTVRPPLRFQNARNKQIYNNIANAIQHNGMNWDEMREKKHSHGTEMEKQIHPQAGVPRRSPSTENPTPLKSLDIEKIRKHCVHVCVC